MKCKNGHLTEPGAVLENIYRPELQKNNGNNIYISCKRFNTIYLNECRDKI